MTEQLPQYPPSHDFPELSYNDLRKYFRLGEFSITRDTTVISDIEFGIDWRIEPISEIRRVTGTDFIIQSKTTGNVEEGDYISFEIETKNINYLWMKAVPVFIHLL